MTLNDRLLLLALRIGTGLAAFGVWLLKTLWLAFLSFSAAGKAVAIAAVLLTAAWVSSRLGFSSVAGELRDAGVLVVSLLMTWAVIRLVWTRFTQPSRHRRVF